MYEGNATSPNTTAADGARNIPSRSSAGQLRSGPRGTLQVVSLSGVSLVRPANTGALRCVWYQSCAQNGSSWKKCTWLNRSAEWLPAYSTSAASGPRMYPKPPVRVGRTPLALASAICAFVKPGVRPVQDARLVCVSVTCQPKCQIAVCGDVAGAATTWVKRTRTSFGAASAGNPPQRVGRDRGNCLT